MKLHAFRLRMRFGVFAILIVTATSSFAATVSKIDDAALLPLRGSSVMRKIRIDALPLTENTKSVIDLEEFQVWAPGGKVIIHGDGGKVLSIEEPTPMRFYRGLVNGDSQSFAYFSVDQAGHVYGLVATREHKYAITAQRRPSRTRADRDVRGEAGEYDHFLTVAQDDDEIAPGQTWECVADRQKMTPGEVATRPIYAGTETLKAQPAALTGTQTYGITIEVETDFEFYTNAGSNSTTAQNYATNLTGAVSTIYNRDLKTNVTQSAVNIYTSSSDPWAATDALNGLYEVGDYYHNVSLKPAGRTTSEVVFLSGKALGSGIAWEGIVCGSDFSQSGHWGGPYAWCGGIGNLGTTGFGSIPDPNGQNGSGVNYGMPSGTQNYWPLAEYAHEVGHNLGGHHTHCVAISSAEAATTNHPTQLFIDACHTGEVDQYYNPYPTLITAPCATGIDYGSAPTESGTIMSYCHNVFSGMGYPRSRFIFGVASEVSNHELTDFMLNPAGPLIQGGPRNIVNGTTATLSSITAPASVAANSTGNTASVTNTGGQTYSWSITGGSITAGVSTASVTFTAGASGSVVLTVNAVNSTLCSLRDSKSITITSAIAAPTNVVATPLTSTSVQISWTASPTATSYEVYRSTDHVNYTGPACTATSSAVTCTDTTASAGVAYLYKVRATAPSTSAFSSPDLATTVIFTDSTLTQQSTLVKAAHINELRTAVNAVCTLAGTSATYTTAAPTAGVSTVKAADINDLRSAINTARSALSLSAATYNTSAPVAGSSTIQAADITDLRTAVK